MPVHLILGGARSGKSSFAESVVTELSEQRPRHYVATAQACDEEMQSRIQHHQQRRDDRWTEHECPTQLPALISRFTENDVVLVDCLTLWMNNIIFNHGETASESEIQSQVTELVSALQRSPAAVVLVSNEVGLGIVPMGEVTRLFVDHAGWMNQAIAKVAQQVTFVAAGLPMQLKNVVKECD
ncbi:bifunctional adenosylcobinamide kinase/adenosylcobinamide-phosphate guanylyltransferase [Vibrio japonicus]|uniref:Bifunctional adenosylcobalamin biosynthesis protein n=1 Tax=Vibrio japonicus TaxID=1824638 RepID=A0ABY5LI91_9VIBR|nr:bifunctional adenosylcobinamide kinase/adenosylcobinamide-phosphate guanylyltransferase [Vibrio japonicus]UUM29510.1 bifunctional adenosylcobinamide kinase/adenosylcobinamide-phosphate guanylyltransferase [Vibrio japonicus]